MTRRRPVALAAVLLAALTLAAFSPLAVNRGFVFDDEGYVLENSRVREGLTAAGLRWAFVSFETANWYPLTWISHMLDVEFFGLDARGHHAVNLLLHVLNAALLFLGLRRLTGALWRSFAMAALFAVHPLHVEAVAWVSERKDLLGTLFGFLAVGAWLGWVRRRSRRSWVLAIALFALSLLSKPMLVTLPGVLLLLDWWPLGRLGRGHLQKALVEKTPLLLLSAASSAVTVIASAQSETLQSLARFPLAGRAANALLSCAIYLRKTFWPANLAAFYPFAPDGVLFSAAAGAALLLATVTAMALARARREPYLLAGWLLFLGTLVPVIGLVQIGEHAMADRYTYVPLVGVFGALAWGLPRLGGAAGTRERHLAAATATLLLGLAAATALQTTRWRDAGALWRHALTVTRSNWLAHNNLGIWHFKRGETATALAEFTRAIAIKPAYAEALYNAAFALAALRRLDEAERQARAAIDAAPRWVPPRTLLATTLFRLGRWEEALREYLAAVQLDPGRVETHRLLADALHDRGMVAEAERHYREAVRLDPHLPETRNELGILLAGSGRFAEAGDAFRAALQLRRDYPQAHYNLGKALDELGDIAGAMPHYREAIRLDPAFADAHNNLAVDLLLSGDRTAALEHLSAALRIRPDFQAARANLERALAAGGAD